MSVYGTDELWERLKSKDKPILIYGMGNGADKVLSALDIFGIEADGFFASDGFVRGQFFHGKKVMTYGEACEKFGDFIVLVSFGSCLPDVMENVQRIASEKETYAPDVPVAGNELMTKEFFLENEEKIKAARALFADEYSRRVFDEILRYKIDGKISHFAVDTDKSEALTSLLSGGYSAYLDLGAYVGDTIDEAVENYPTIKKVCAFEPSPRVFGKLQANVSKYENIDFSLLNACASSSGGNAVFADGGGRNSQIKSESAFTAHGAKAVSVPILAPDGACNFKGEKLLIKFDIEGEEAAALMGCKRLIKENDCEMIVSAYHRCGDIFELPLLIHSLTAKGKLYLRKHPYIPAWDINIYVTK
ncbi:MAG: FkbM family methyltransferase [Clostridiales bacterium]|nr:FkbM family methyltransferase [Clostridiales bacterium]